MNITAIVSSVKMDAGITTNAYDQRLKEYVLAAKDSIEREGIKLSDNLEDRDLVARYAAWMWKKRDSGQGLPKMIRWQMNNRIFGRRGDNDA